MRAGQVDRAPDSVKLAERDPMWWVCSYPKSGNTWVRMLLYTYHFKMTGSSGLTRFDDANRYFYRALSPDPLADLTVADMVMLRMAVLLHIRSFQEGPLAIKSHHANGTVGGVPMFSPAWCDKVVHVVRDPRDVACSFADHLGWKIEETIDFLGNATAGLEKEPGIQHIITSWSHHVMSFLQHPDLDLLTVRYEDLKRDTEGTFIRILKHLEYDDIHPETVSEAVEENEFGWLREAEMDGGFKQRSDKQERFFRKGEAGGWRDELTPDQASRIMDQHGEVYEKVYEREPHLEAVR